MLRKRKLQFLSSFQSENSVITYISSLMYNSQQSSFSLYAGNGNCITAKATPAYCQDSQLLMTFGRTLIYPYLSLGAKLQAWHTMVVELARSSKSVLEGLFSVD